MGGYVGDDGGEGLDTVGEELTTVQGVDHGTGRLQRVYLQLLGRGGGLDVIRLRDTRGGERRTEEDENFTCSRHRSKWAPISALGRDTFEMGQIILNPS